MACPCGFWWQCSCTWAHNSCPAYMHWSVFVLPRSEHLQRGSYVIGEAFHITKKSSWWLSLQQSRAEGRLCFKLIGHVTVWGDHMNCQDKCCSISPPALISVFFNFGTHNFKCTKTQFVQWAIHRNQLTLKFEKKRIELSRKSCM